MEHQLKEALAASLVDISTTITTTGNIEFLLKSIKPEFIIEMLAKDMLANKNQYVKYFL